MKQAGKQFAVAQVGGMDYEGRGVARVAGKTLFIRGALPLEQVAYRVVRSKKQFDEAANLPFADDEEGSQQADGTRSPSASDGAKR